MAKREVLIPVDFLAGATVVLVLLAFLIDRYRR